MNPSTTQNKKFILPLMLFFGSLICTIYAICIDLPSAYELLPFLPLSYTVLLFLTLPCISKNIDNVATLLIVLLTFVRFCLAPIVLILGNYKTIFKYDLSQYTRSAILLMIYELVVIFLVMAFANHKKSKTETQTQKKRLLKMNWIGGITVLMLVYCVAVYFLFPGTKMMFRTIFELGEEDFTTVLFSSAELQVGSIQRALQTLFSAMFDFVRLLLPAYLLWSAKKRGSKDGTLILIALVSIAAQFLFITSTFAKSIICSLVIVLLLMRLCPQKRRVLSVFGSFMVVAIILIFFFVRFGVKDGLYGDSPWEYVSNIVNAYFTGIDNVAAALKVPRENVFSTFLFELYSGIPFHNTLFGLEGVRFQELLNEVNRSYGQIPPTIGSGHYFFGAFFSPILSGLLVFISVRFAQAAKRTDLYFKYLAYTFGAIVVALGVAMYDWTIVYSWFTMWILPLMILSYFSGDSFLLFDDQLKPRD